MKIFYACSAFNEQDNIEELFTRVRDSWDAIRRMRPELDLSFKLFIGDNCSNDKTLEAITQFAHHDPNVICVSNHSNYGSESSIVNIFMLAKEADIVVFLCSDLQDPPEESINMVDKLLEDKSIDAVLGIKIAMGKPHPLDFARSGYYKALSVSSRFKDIPYGFHGFGAYRIGTINETLLLWQQTDFTLRQCLINASSSNTKYPYRQSPRKAGGSSYNIVKYISEALKSILATDAISSRLTLITSLIFAILTFVVLLTIIIGYILGVNIYAKGIPTVLCIMFMCFSMQTFLIALISRQLELLRHGGYRKRVRYTIL